jgi:hypothetical protein
MAANKKESKAQAVRNYFQEHPDAKPQEVEKALLDSQNIKVSAKYISYIKSRKALLKVRRERKKAKEDKSAPAKGQPHPQDGVFKCNLNKKSLTNTFYI